MKLPVEDKFWLMGVWKLKQKGIYFTENASIGNTNRKQIDFMDIGGF